jgi:hypothetical protein
VPEANIGIATGEESDLIVLDVDGAEGEASLKELERDHEPLPKTLENRTGGGGRHLYFQWPGFQIRNSVQNIGEKLDIRGDGGQVVAPPSIHLSGDSYKWTNGVDYYSILKDLVAPCPEWLAELIKEKQESSVDGPYERTVDSESILDGVPEGERDNEIWRYACSLRARGTDRVEAEILITHAANNCDPPFAVDVALEKVERVWSEYDGKKKTKPAKEVTHSVNLGFSGVTGIFVPRTQDIEAFTKHVKLRSGEVLKLLPEELEGKLKIKNPEQFAGQDVVLWPENTETSIKTTYKIAYAVRSHARSVFILEGTDSIHDSVKGILDVNETGSSPELAMITTGLRKTRLRLFYDEQLQNSRDLTLDLTPRMVEKLFRPIEELDVIYSDEDPEIQMIVDPLIREASILYIYGDAGAGKTNFGLEIAAEVQLAQARKKKSQLVAKPATIPDWLKAEIEKQPPKLPTKIRNNPGPFDGFWTVDYPVNVAYIDAEMPFREDFRPRTKSFGYKGHALSRAIKEKLGGKGTMTLLDPELRSALLEAWVENDIELVFLDNLANLQERLEGESKRWEDDWIDIGSWLVSVRGRGISAMLFAHESRAGEIYGTMKQKIQVDVILRMVKENPLALSLDQVKEIFNPPDGYIINMDKLRTFSFSLQLGTKDKVRQDLNLKRILNKKFSLVSLSGESMVWIVDEVRDRDVLKMRLADLLINTDTTQVAAAKELGIGDSNAKKMVAEMKKTKWLETKPYRFTAKGQAIFNEMSEAGKFEEEE